MKENNKYFKLLKGHFYLLGFILLNFGIEMLTGFRLNQNVIFLLKIILYLSGIIFFFLTWKPFKLISVYFSFYAISGILMGTLFLFGGIFFAIVSSIFLYPIYPRQVAYKTPTLIIYNRFQGFMSPCCSYEVAVPKLYIFEKRLGFIAIEKPIEPDKDEFKRSNNTLIYKYETVNYNYKHKTIRDTTEILRLQK